ncbi:MAG: 3-deoxy-manno-octulosonate cytidylyltransferase, partial [Rivularia sp. (in: cyanobacteria)]
MNILAVIPARYNSTRFPGKPLVMIGDRPMVQRVYEAAKSCPHFSKVVVATDSEIIANCV